MQKWLLAGLAVLIFSSAVFAQTQPEVPDLSGDLTETEFRAMLGRLSDEQVRDILISEFAARRAETPTQGGSLLANAQNVGESLSANARALFAQWPDVGRAFAAVGNRLSEAGGFGLALLALLVSLAVGFTVRFFWRRKAAQRQLALAERNVGKGSYGTVATIGDAALFLVIDLSSVVAFAVSAMATLYLFFHNGDLRIFVSSFIAIVSVILIVWSFLELMFPRNWPVYRLVAISDSATRLLYWWIVGMAGLWVFEANITNLMARFGAPGRTPDLISLLFSFVWITVALSGVYLLHRETSDLLPGRDEKSLASAVTRNWALLMGVGAVVTWMLFAGGGIVSGAVDAIAIMNLKMTLV
ncbi:MAG: hypothetical protein AAFW60_13100, partial [Pseudomonadota bacterium]